MRTTKILIACGGSGGHIFPGIALAEALVSLNKDSQIFIVTSNRYIDTQIFKETKFLYGVLPYNPLPDTINPLKIFGFLVRLIKAVFSSVVILRKHKPSCVVGMGGYVSGPIIFAAWLMRMPILVHEQNIVPGVTNKLSAIFADKTCVTFDKSKDYFKKRQVIKTGNPIRHHFLKQDLGNSYKSLGLDQNRFTILIMGGSQGSTFLNNSFRNAIQQMDDSQRAELQILHITGKNDFSSTRQTYNQLGVKARIYSFLEKMGYAYDAADLIISRAGATALSEITAFGKPSILIPHPKTRIHQKENAEFFSNCGAGLFIEEKNLSPEYLKKTILGLMNDSGRLDKMANQSKMLGDPEAAYRLAKEILDLNASD